MSLGLNTIHNPPARRGAPRKPVEAVVVRELTKEELEGASDISINLDVPNLKKLTDRHHTLARLIAGGMKDTEAEIATGYAPGRASVLRSDPAFNELLSLYRDKVTEEFISVHEHMAGLSRDALLEMRQRIEEAPEKFSNNELLRLVAEMVDRSSLEDPASKNAPVQINLVAVPAKSVDD